MIRGCGNSTYSKYALLTESNSIGISRCLKQAEYKLYIEIKSMNIVYHCFSYSFMNPFTHF